MIAQRILARSRRLKIESKKLLSSLLHGSYTSVWRGSGISFKDVRAYETGDDIRHIDWNVTSRFDDTFVKTFEEERDKNLFIILDQSLSMREGMGIDYVEECVEIVCAVLGLATVFNNDKIGGCVISDHIEKWIPLKRGIKHGLSLIDTLIQTKTTSNETNFSLAFKSVNAYLKHRSICVIISDFKTEGYIKELTMLSKRHEVFALRTVNREDTDISDLGYISSIDPETGKVFHLFSHGNNFRHAYRDNWANQRKSWFYNMKKIGVYPFEITNQDDPLIALYNMFNSRKRKR